MYKYHCTYLALDLENFFLYIGVKSFNTWEQFYSYNTSSKLVSKLPIHKEVLSFHATREDALEQEVFLHAFFDVKNNDSFLNKANQTSSGFDNVGFGKNNPFYGKTHTPEVRKRVSEARKKHKASKVTREKRSKSLKGTRCHLCKEKIHWVHDSGVEEFMYRFELQEKYNLLQSKVSLVASGKRKSHRGWRLKGEQSAGKGTQVSLNESLLMPDAE